MDRKLLSEYRKYATSLESHAVFFVKDHLLKAKGHWVDIHSAKKYQTKDNYFQYVNGALYIRTIKPKYPPRSKFVINNKFNQREYYFAVRAITWDTARRDIEKQQRQNIKPLYFKLRGSYDMVKTSDEFFRDDAPANIKALAKNLNDRTDPLWNQALHYITEPKYEFKLRSVKLYR